MKEGKECVFPISYIYIYISDDIRVLLLAGVSLRQRLRRLTRQLIIAPTPASKRIKISKDIRRNGIYDINVKRISSPGAFFSSLDAHNSINVDKSPSLLSRAVGREDVTRATQRPQSLPR